MSMSGSSFMLVLGIMLVTVMAIYATLFSVGTGFEEKTDKVDKIVPPAKTESKPEPHEIRHAA